MMKYLNLYIQGRVFPYEIIHVDNEKRVHVRRVDVSKSDDTPLLIVRKTKRGWYSILGHHVACEKPLLIV